MIFSVQEEMPNRSEVVGKSVELDRYRTMV